MADQPQTQALTPPGPRLTSLSPGAGCACKLPLAKLEALFASMGDDVPAMGPASGDLLIGAAEGDDAAVLRLDDERALVLTTDFFTPIVDDPWDWGRIAAANALSDVYAMGGRPLFAVNLAAWPGDGLDIAILGQVLRGGAQVAAQAACFVAGGHTIDDPVPKYGLAVVGLADPDALMTIDRAAPGDQLILTKALGTGVVATALKRDGAPAEAVQAAVASMTLLNAGAGQAALAAGVRAATDVTGFGLLGHLHRMLAASGVAARLWAGSVPLLPGAAQLAAAGFVSGGTRANTDRMRGFAMLDAAIPPELAVLLHDAQTSGGLLLAVPPAAAPALLSELRAQALPAAVIGDVVPGKKGHVDVQPGSFGTKVLARYLGAVKMRPGAVRTLLSACLLAVLAAVLSASTASAQTRGTTPVRHVVVVGISGLRWSDVSPSATPTLWRLAGQGSVGSLVDYAVKPLTCPADAWLTLNAGARAQSDHTNAACGAFPAVNQAGTGAVVPAMAALEVYNNQFHNNANWGLLAQSTPGCATAVGPGAALALADPTGRVASYLPSAAGLTAGVLARCPLTVVDLGNIDNAERSSALAWVDAQLARIAADLPAGSTLLVTAPGSTTKPPHLQLALVNGPGYRAGLLDAASTRQPGMVVLTDLTPTVLGWLARPGSASAMPSDAVGAQITRGDRGALASTVQSLAGRDTAEQVWRSTHDEFFWAYALADAVVLAAIGLAFWGSAEDQRRRRARWWRVAGVFAAAVPVATFLANLVPWSTSAHPAAALYSVSAALAIVIGLAALAGSLGPWRRDRLAPFGVVCLFTLVVLAIDVMTGSRLQLETPFGLSVLEAGRFYGIGNEALGIYGISGLLGAAWLGLVALRRSTSSRPSRRPAVLVVAGVATFAVFASGWPGFGGKVGGTIAMVPCFALLALVVAGIRLTWRRILLVAVSGLALFAVFALINYFVPITGKSDISSFAGSSLHGHSGSLLLRKINSNIGSLSVNAFSPVVPVVVVWTGLMLWRPAWFGLKTEPRAYAAEPLMGPILGVLWLLPVLGWFADDSGVIVPAAVLPFALPLGIALLAAAAYQDHEARYRETTVPVAGSSPVSRK